MTAPATRRTHPTDARTRSRPEPGGGHVPDQTTDLWASAVDHLSTAGTMGTGKVAMLRMTSVLDVDDILVVVVGSAFARDTFEKDRATISASLAAVAGRQVPFEIIVDPSLEAVPAPVQRDPRPTPRPATPPAAPTAPAAPVPVATSSPAAGHGTTTAPTVPESTDGANSTTGTAPAAVSGTHPLAPTPARPAGLRSVPQPTVAPEQRPAGTDHSRLNPHYTFDTYVTGGSNRFANAASLAVAEAPGTGYNPLFIYGGSGLGKTHLLHAIGNYARELSPTTHVKYVSSEEFVSDFIDSVQVGRMSSFKDRYRGVDILLLDDIQFLSGKESTLEEFFHTFNALRLDNKQIVLTSDQPPKELKGFEDRLISRFTEGLTADVQPPDLETRLAILARRARDEGQEVPAEVQEYIASRVTTNIRELEGALIRVTAFASLTKQPIDLTLAEMVLKDIISDPDGEQITASLIMAQTADYFGMTIDDLCGKVRTKTFVHARHVAMYLCRELTDLSLPQIGREFGKDHTTVINANRKIVEQMSERRSTYNEVMELTSRIKQAAQTARR
ncbi:chromosomal replication initiator protein DnaA [Actinomyces sp. 186855]|nr:chromosomal replication initiator protein DnaA [Actinomyces sp. AC-20-1]MCL3789499.1 chromosomal replication initiator protein DnaA [Actinomyces sp. 187325]MCL3791828.1 chromosomal replication initiator protein DnaA [Actinomyces sp. 186855]MCL3793507.1 chromosomal replication initiator protein DnaA [Actinomyces sp. 217892]